MSPHDTTKRKRYLQVFTMSALSAAMAAAQAQAPAPKATPTELEAVVVTAQRTKENAKDVPVSASLMKSEQLDTILTSGHSFEINAFCVLRMIFHPASDTAGESIKRITEFFLRAHS